MFLVQTSRAKRTRKYLILMTAAVLMSVLGFGILTIHWEVPPRKK
jgi:hypothetical protein